jgi:hypothetical protein
MTNGTLELCERNDPNACSFEVASPNHEFGSVYTYHTKTLLEAQLISRIAVDAYEAGKKAAENEFKQWLEE